MCFRQVRTRPRSNSYSRQAAVQIGNQAARRTMNRNPRRFSNAEDELLITLVNQYGIND